MKIGIFGFKLNILLIIIFFLSGCVAPISKVEWETGKVYNPQFAEKVIIVDKFDFTAELKAGLRTEAVVKGDISKCIVKSLRNTLIGYAVLNEDEANNISPKATIIRITPTKVSTSFNFWRTKILGNVYVKIHTPNSVKELEGEGSGKAEEPKICFKGMHCVFETAFNNACDDLATKIEKLLTAEVR